MPIAQRVTACAELGRSVDARVYHGEGDAVVDFVLSLNMVRRHLTHNDKVVAANKALPYYTSEARQRQGTRTDLTPDISANMRESGKAGESQGREAGKNSANLRSFSR